MLNKFFKLLGSLALVAIVLLVGAAVWFGINASKNTDIARPYFESRLPAILSWDFQQLAPLLTPSLRRDLDTEPGQATLRMYSQLGMFRSYEQLQYLGATSVEAPGEEAYELVAFSLLGHFAAGDAQIRLTLARTADAYLVHSMNIQAAVFRE